jgi:hypothetical protein
MARRLTRVRRSALLVALLASAALYAYAVAGIVGDGDDLRAAAIAQRSERAVPAAYEPCPYEHDDQVRL